jgi:hypothetical protein
VKPEQALYGASFVKVVRSIFSFSLSLRGILRFGPRCEHSSALSSLRGMASKSFFCAHFSGSTAPQAFPRPDRRMLTPARAGRVKAGRSSAATVRLGLDTTEHDGTLSTIGRRLDQ